MYLRGDVQHITPIFLVCKTTKWLLRIVPDDPQSYEELYSRPQSLRKTQQTRLALVERPSPFAIECA
jgi:hypothetical protein